MYSFPNLEPVCSSMSSSNCCFLTCIKISQKAGKVVWYSHLLKNFPQFVVIYTHKGFGVINKATLNTGNTKTKHCQFLNYLTMTTKKYNFEFPYLLKGWIFKMYLIGHTYFFVHDLPIFVLYPFVHFKILRSLAQNCKKKFSTLYCCSVPKSCPTLHDPKDCSMPGFSVPHCLMEFVQMHVHWANDTIQPFCPLSPSSSPFNLSQHRDLFQWVSLSHQVAKVLELPISVLPMSIQGWLPLEYTGLISLLSKRLTHIKYIYIKIVGFASFSSFKHWSNQYTNNFLPHICLQILYENLPFYTNFTKTPTM